MVVARLLPTFGTISASRHSPRRFTVNHDQRTQEIDTGETSIFVQSSGSGPPLLLLHGFPETHLMWRGVLPALAKVFTVVCPDLRGYGNSGCPASAPDHAAYAKRALAQDMVTVMERLGFSRFSVAGHDRGGRVAYRMALDHPERVERLAALDVLPTETAWSRADARLAMSFWPWSLLAQPAPLPERILVASPEAIVDNALTEWGTPGAAFAAEVRDAYIQVLEDPNHAHGICEEYRAAATIDREHDRADLAMGRRIACPYSHCGVLKAGSICGTKKKEGLWHFGASGVTMFAVIRCKAAIFSQRSFRNKRRKN